MKSLKMDDRYHDLVRTSGPKKEAVLDMITQSKLPQDLEISGKPNVLMSFTSIENDKYVMN